MFPSLGAPEMVVVMLVAVLLFGKRLPEVGRSLGKGIIEFKKGLRGLEDDEPLGYSAPSNRAVARPSTPTSSTMDDPYAASVPKFEPPTSAPVPQTGYEPQPFND